MNFFAKKERSAHSLSKEYDDFRSTVPIKSIAVGNGPHMQWQLCDVGARSVHSPLIFLPSAAGSTDCFYRQLLSLPPKGFRVIAVSYPVCESVDQFCHSFRSLLNHLKLRSVHVCGVLLGAFLAQKFAEFAQEERRVASLVLCHGYSDVETFDNVDSLLLRLAPEKLLKYRFTQILRETLPCADDISDSLHFLSEQMMSLSRGQLSSRILMLANCEPVQCDLLQRLVITLVHSLDSPLRDHPGVAAICAAYPRARLAYIKTGGTYPFITRSDEFDMLLQVHLRPFFGTDRSPSTATIQQINDPPVSVT